MRASLQALIDRLVATDPDVVAASHEVDAELLDWFASLSVEERLRRSTSMAATLESLASARRTS